MVMPLFSLESFVWQQHTWLHRCAVSRLQECIGRSSAAPTLRENCGLSVGPSLGFSLIALANKVDRPSLFRCRAFCDLGPVNPIISEGTVSQVINVTNAMQGTKTLMMKLKIQFQRGGVSVAEMAQVAQFPAGY